MEKQVQEIVDKFYTDIIKIDGVIYGKIVKYVKPYDDVDEYALDWINPININKQNIAENSKSKVIICDDSIKYNEVLKQQGKLLLITENPKLLLIKIIEHFFSETHDEFIHPTAIIGDNVVIGKNVYIGPNCIIEKNVSIGSNTVLLGHNFVNSGVKMGDNVTLQSGVIIGNEGHNFVRDKKNKCIKFPHIGNVVIGNNVEIGGNSFVSRGVLSDTIISDGTKIAQLVYIGANVKIGVSCAIRANATILGSVVLGDNVIIAPSVTVRDHRKIGNNVIVGMGAVVLKNINNNEIWIGNPAKKKCND